MYLLKLLCNQQLNFRHSQFKWYRPKTDRKTLVESTSKYQAEMLQKLLKDKEREMRLLAKQVMKFNKENFTLLRELEGYVNLIYMIYCFCKLNLLFFLKHNKLRG